MLGDGGNSNARVRLLASCCIIITLLGALSNLRTVEGEQRVAIASAISPAIAFSDTAIQPTAYRLPSVKLPNLEHDLWGNLDVDTGSRLLRNGARSQLENAAQACSLYLMRTLLRL